MVEPLELPEPPAADAAFVRQVHEALAHLYDLPYLHVHPFVRTLAEADEPLTGDALRRLLVEQIEQMRPPEPAPPTSPFLRRYRCLVLRYLRGATPESVARELGVSPRQARRDHAEAVESLAGLLWRRRRPPSGAATRRASSAAGPPAVEERVGPRAVPVAADEPSLDAELRAVRDRASAGRRCDSTDLAETVRDALEIVAGLAAARGVRFEVAVPEALPPVAAERIILRQALLSLLGHVVQVEPGARVEVAGSESEGGAVLELRVAPPVARAAGRGPEAAGQSEALLETGRRLLEAQGGTLELAASPDGGLGIRLALPLQPGARVLVVDDNPDVARLFRRFLRGRRYELLQASTGQKALRLAREARPELITLDLLMPSQDGWDILRQLKADPETQAVPVVVCSILPDRDLALAVGAAEFLAKPVTQAALVATLDRLVGASRLGHLGRSEGA